MHTNFHKGTPIFIIFKDDSTTCGKFSDHKSGKVLLEDGRSIELSKVRTMTIRKLKTSEGEKSGKKIIFRKK
ncbi:MAG: hypothetical protein WC107_01455 [Patescibacteria group bacterium]